MMSKRDQGLALCTLVLAACGGSGRLDAHEGSDAETPRENAAQEPITAEQLDAFSETLTRWYDASFEPPASIEQVVASLVLVIYGDFVSVKSGRKEFAGRGCDNADEATGTCVGDPNTLMYDSYVNLIIHPRRMVKGKLEVPNSDVSVEQPWPNNLDVDELLSYAPVGARVIVFGEPVRGAKEGAKPLEEAGIVAANSVADNLIQVPPYGFVMEGLDGSAIMPMVDNQRLRELIPDGGEALDDFDDVLQKVAAAQP